MGVVNFIEKQRSVYLYDYLVFICGVDVSAYIEELVIYYQDRNGHGSADIVLSNPFDQWVLSSLNLRKSFRNTEDRYSEKAKLEIFNKKKNLSKKIAYKLKRKGDDYSGYQQAEELPPVSAKELKEAEEFDFLQRYAFGPGTCVFSRFDTVKIFVKNPTDPSEWNRWIPAFTGTIENKPFNTDYVNGRSTISLHAYDIRASMQAMRVGVNPVQNASFTDNAEGKTKTTFFDSDAAGFFKDYYPDSNNRSAFDNIFEGLSFVDMVSMVITGKTGWVAGGNPVDNGTGVGFFKPGKVIRYANPKNTSIKDPKAVRNLEKWDNLCLFGVNSSGIPRNGFLTEKECRNIGRNSFWQNPYSPMNGNMHFLIPAEGLGISDMITSSVNGFKSIMSSPDWTNRYALVTQICQQIDYEWNVTGSGDIIFEFPMYDFFPEDFGSNSTIYTINSHLISDEISDEGGEVIAALEASSQSPDIAKGQFEQVTNQAPTAVGIPDMRCVVVSNTLASKYGARVVTHSFTGVKGPEQLQKMAYIEFFKRLADANKLTVNFSPIRPWLRPNRPFKNAQRNRLGKITSVRLSFPSLREPTTSVSLHCVKLPIYKNGKISYANIAGGASCPISYNAIFESPSTIGNPDSGITILSPSTKDNQTK